MTKLENLQLSQLSGVENEFQVLHILEEFFNQGTISITKENNGKIGTV